ncbi:cytochrome P450 [Laetiporus sulphureus 93-53]|uniref:Cytochrome P450 n=1 Tax=Laetiporus sulphureus 93-53 TaxID=1314785 RepID=A0A165E5J9_9APHY|nr:cytochrome P450 [Laetiporus sulphureus 93-53]KZT06281.1 cytochrome P450 [Laetiporus sulphureus 93-53]
MRLFFPGLPFFGNLFQLNHESWHIFTEWKKIYGPIVYLNIGGQPVVVLNTHKVAGDLLDRRAINYSDRPRLVVAGEILTRGIMLGLTRYGDVWRRMRRACHEALNPGVASNYHQSQQAEAVLLAYGIMKQPDLWFHHLRRVAASTITSMLYDMPPLESPTDPSIANINNMAARITKSSYPGTHLVEFFTFLEYLPKSLAKWKREADEWYQRYTVGFEKSYEVIHDRVMAGEEQRPSFCATLAETQSRHHLSNKEASWLAATMYIAGSETTSSCLSWFMLCMIAFRDAQAKAAKEIEEVIGHSRLPSFADWDHLPYVRALLKEVLRWHTVDPLGLPHASVEDDYYEGYFIPKGTICIPNVWAMNRDPDIYGPNAHLFRPERHLDEHNRLNPSPADTKDEGHVTYGFGRRICVGRHVANYSLFIDIATILWALKLEPERDAEGNYIEPDVVSIVSDGLVVRPAPFNIVTSLRFPEAENMLANTREEILQAHS